MSSQGPNNGTASDFGSGNPGGSFQSGNAAWTNISNMNGISAFATCVLSNTNVNTNVAEIKSLGFAIPIGSTILGVVVSWTGKDSSGSHDGTVTIQLLKAGSPTGTAKTVGMITSSSGYSEGSSSDLWGATLAASDVNGSTFGVGIQEQGASGANTVSIENVQIEVYYTPPALSTTNVAAMVATPS